MDKKELLIKLCQDIFAGPVGSEKSNALIDLMVRYVENGEIPFKVNAVDVVVYDNSMYDLGVADLGEYMIYDSLKTGKGKDDGQIVMTRFIRLTKGVGENMRELCIEL